MPLVKTGNFLGDKGSMVSIKYYVLAYKNRYKIIAPPIINLFLAQKAG